MASMIELNRPLYVQAQKALVLPTGTVPVLYDSTDSSLKVYNKNTQTYDAITTIKFAGGSKSSAAVSGDTSAVIAKATNRVIVGAAGTTITLGSADLDPPSGASYDIWDATGAAATTPHTIVPYTVGHLINGQASFTFDRDYGRVVLVRSGNNWLASYG